mgnify:CR=1 FL=1
MVTKLVEDWEDGDLTPTSSNWDPWSGDTGSLSNVTSDSPFEGSRHGLIAGSGVGNDVASFRDSAVEANSFTFALKTDTQSGDDSDRAEFTLRGSDGRVAYIFMNGGGTITVDSDSGSEKTLTSSWSTNTYYEFTVDVDNQTVTNNTTGDSVSLTTAGTEISRIEVSAYLFGTADTMNVWFDGLVGDLVLPPAAPDDLTATAAGGDAIDLTWSEAGGAQDVDIYRSQSPGVDTSGSFLVTLPADSTSFTDTGLEDGERYYYVLEVGNSVGSDVSNEAAATTDLPATTPDFDTETGGEIIVTVSKADDSPDGEFELYRSQDGSLGSLIADSIAPGASSVTNANVVDGRRYWYTLRRITDHTQADGQADAVSKLPQTIFDSVEEQ